MGMVEEVRQVLQDFLAPELREIRTRLDSVDKRLETQDKRLDTIEDANRVRFEAIVQRLEQIQQSFAFDKRISSLEAEKTRSA
jgi:tetrahydromethanopterin S-methyltransferase subunit G